MTATQKKLQILAIHFGESLMPCDCMDILKDFYGRKLENLQFRSIFQRMKDMMATATDVDYSEDIRYQINSYMEEI